MLKQKKYIGLVAFALIGFTLYYWFYVAGPSEFPSEEEQMQQLNEVHREQGITSVEEPQFIDSEHVVVPFETSSNHVGISHWIWEKHDWKAINLDDGDPVLWKVDRNDPSSYVITWHFQPSYEIDSLSFYLLNERTYRVSYGNHFYNPGVQMKESIPSPSTPYGVMKMPEDWAYYMEGLSETSAQTRSLQVANPQLHFGFSAFNQQGERFYPRSGNITGYNAGYGGFQFVTIKDEADLENVHE